MSKHLSHHEIRVFAAGDLPVSELFELSKHMAGCRECRDAVENISPGFFETADLERAVPEEVDRHFSAGEIAGFLDTSVSLKTRLGMSAHFRECTACRQKLFGADPQRLRKTIAGFLEAETISNSVSAEWSLSALIPVGAFSLLLICLLAYLLTFGLVKDEPVPELARALDASNVERPNIGSELPSVKDSSGVGDTPAVARNTANNQRTRNTTNRQTTRSDANQASKNVISETRSANAECGDGRAFVIVSPYSERVTTRPTFRWKALSDAVSYHLYVSDTEQILIEEAELTGSTSYTLKTTLEAGKTYKWSIVATFADGRTVNSPPIYFSPGKIPQNDRLNRGTGIFGATRCTN